MSTPRLASWFLSFAAVALAAAAGPAQAPAVAPDFQKREAELSKSAASTLVNFARNAAGQKVNTRAKQAYDLVLDHYETENASARSALGYKKVQGKWELPAEEKRPKWEDKASNEQRFRVVDEWAKTAKKLGDLHRVLGLELVKGEQLARGSFHLERAVYYYPFDKEAHLALGHVEDHGFWGTPDQVTFVRRMKEIETKALELARQDYPAQPQPLEEMPEELVKSKLEYHGAKTEHFMIWTRGTQENADNCVKWAERALDFMVYLVGDKEAKKRQLVQRVSGIKWWGFVWTDIERTDFLKANPHIYEGKTLDDAKRFANVSWASKSGPAMVMMKLTPAQMHDTMIVWVFHLCLGQGHNEALAEGLQHTATWYLMSTSINQFGALPEGTVAGKELKLPESTNWWLRRIRDQAMSATDWPVNLVPRERLASFRNDVRIKSWSFMTWLLARHPEQWLAFFYAIPDKKVIPTEDVEKACEDKIGRKLAEVEAEWREWARGDSGVAAATGYGPPLLPERPNKEELAALARMNQIRGSACAYALTNDNMTEGKLIGLPACDLDAEASLACEDHAKYLTKWPEQHLKWPEAHEENPALEGFSPKGMRAGMRSVILWTNGDPGEEFARDSVDGWMGTPYHRFPLLEHNIYRFGYSYVTDNGFSIGVLDMGSLEEPYDPSTAPKLVAWPPPGMKDVPLRFHGREHPNPLGDQPESEQDITKTGYPISLQIQQEYATTFSEASIKLYEVTMRSSKAPPKHFVGEGTKEHNEWRLRVKSPKDPAKFAEVPIWEHTPLVPLLKRMEIKDVVFAIPKTYLEPRTLYQVEVRIVAQGNSPLMFIWEFTTGGQPEGLKF